MTHCDAIGSAGWLPCPNSRSVLLLAGRLMSKRTVRAGPDVLLKAHCFLMKVASDDNIVHRTAQEQAVFA